MATTLATRPAVATILKGILDWLDDEPTVPAAIVDDLAKMVERCRDLSARVRDLRLTFEGD